ncbi:hypothetical protein C2845_PM02G02710 [Panicum miliaceum]|uniref:Uncharacterized protein n=1 Tax=Panicum miliaceum TaxID=4540 RepID=A0A3L6S514_PANMI|nr:hypothetical protein C2845_PM02G02710 [Panicum miliaceum]
MQSGSGSAHPTSLPEEDVDVPGRPDFVDRFVQANRPIPAAAVRAVTPERERRTSRPETAVGAAERGGYPQQLLRLRAPARVDPACYAAPDLSPVRAVLAMEREHVRNIPRQVRIRYSDFMSRHVAPVRILRVWDWSESTDANGEYVPVYPAAAAP